MRCDQCRYWKADGEDGECHRHAPMLVVVEQTKIYSLWPKTKPDGYCGDWNYKEK